MSNETRWIALLAVLGLLTSYVLWGRPRPVVPAPNIPAQTGMAPSVVIQPVPAPGTVNTTTEKPPAHGATKLKFVPDSLELGTIPVNESRTADISVENPTDAPITVRDLMGSCGCLHITSEKTEIPAGGAISIRAHFTAIPGRKSDVVYGRFKTDEKNNPTAQFDVVAKVKEEILVEPNPSNFGNLAKNAPLTREIRVRSADEKPFQIKSITGKYPEFTFKWEPLGGKNNSVYTVYATMSGSKGGMVNDTAAVITDRAVGGIVTINLSGQIDFDLNAEPSIVTAAKDDAQMVAAFTTVLKRKSPGHLDILGVVDGSRTPLPLDFVVDRLSEDTCRVSIKFKEKYVERPPFGRFQIKTNVEENEYYLPFRLTYGTKLPGPPPK